MSDIVDIDITEQMKSDDLDTELLSAIQSDVLRVSTHGSVRSKVVSVIRGWLGGHSRPCPHDNKRD
jgi:hypothetical protein